MNPESTTGSPVDTVRARIAQYLGPFTAKNAVQMVAKQSFGIDSSQVTRSQLPKLIDGLGPTMRTLIGKEGAENLFAQIRKELGL